MAQTVVDFCPQRLRSLNYLANVALRAQGLLEWGRRVWLVATSPGAGVRPAPTGRLEKPLDGVGFVMKTPRG